MPTDQGVLPPLESNRSFNPGIRLGARFLSYLFHPLFVPVYIVAFLVYEARLMPELAGNRRIIVVLQYFVNYTFLPLAAILIMRKLGFVQSIHLRTQKDRILPYIVCEIFYFWAWYISRNLGYPKEFVLLSLTIFLSCSLGLIFNIYLKISMHAISVGVLAGFLFICGMSTNVNYAMYTSIGLLVAGLTCTARLIDSDHSTREVYSGLIAGVLCLLVAWMFV